VWRCLTLCFVPGRDDDFGLGDAWASWMDSFLFEAPLARVPSIGEDDEPSSELLGRVGAELEAAAVRVRETRPEADESVDRDDDSDEDEDDVDRGTVADRLSALADMLDDAARDGYAVIEWIEKW
jgi:hypothetical protein